MKKSLIIIIGIITVLLFGCEKDTHLTTKDLTYPRISEELQNLYNQMPDRNYGNITVIGDGILKFDSEEHLDSILTLLRKDCDIWDNMFLRRYSNLSEEELEEFEESLNYNEYIPLMMFEVRYNVFGQMLRDVQESEYNRWYAGGTLGEAPSDSIIIDVVEQTLFNPYHEICVGDTIIQLRPDGSNILIPISEIGNIGRFRNMTVTDILEEGSCVVKCHKPDATSLFDDHMAVPRTKKGIISQTTTRKSEWTFKSWPRYNFITGKVKIKSVLKVTHYKLKNGRWTKERRMSRMVSCLSFHSVIPETSYTNPSVIVQQHSTSSTIYGNDFPNQESNVKTITDTYVHFEPYPEDYIELGLGLNSYIKGTIMGWDCSRLLF